MKKLLFGLAAVAIGAVAVRFAISQKAVQQKVGPLPDGGFLLNSGWTIRPAGTQVNVGTFPMSSAVSKDGKYLLVLNCGYDPPSVSVIDIAQKKEVSRTRVADAWLGIVVAPQGNLVYVSGGVTGKVFEMVLDPATGALSIKRELPALPDMEHKGDAMIGDVALSRDGRMVFAADLYGDTISVINRDSGTLFGQWKTGRRPYRILVPPRGNSFFVSSWADGVINQHAALSGEITAKLRVGPHPTDMIWLNQAPPAEEGRSGFVARLFVTASNTNNAYSFGVRADGEAEKLETINVSMTPMHPLGMTPSALATDAKGSHLFVVCSDANAVADVDISAAQSHVSGFIPTGWYPTAISALSDGTLAVLNGKGMGSQPNPHGPNPMKRPAPSHEGATPPAVEYVGHIQTGTAAFLPIPTDEQLDAFSKTVVKNSPYKDEMIYGEVTDAQLAYFSKTTNHTSPIHQVIYIIKENRTYDQVLGDMPKGNGDSSLTLFGEQVTPNGHKLAADYILYDNFYENADVSAEGHNWASAAIAPDYSVKVWPSSYAGRKKGYDYEGGQPANTPPAGYIWNNALQAGVTIRDYGQWCTNLPLNKVGSAGHIDTIKDPSLKPFVDRNYRAFDLDYPDVDRAKEFIKEWNEFDAKGPAPQLSIVRMGNDHTKGTAAGALTPIAYVADNDYAIGMLVDAVSHSKLWASTAIFIIEDDAQNGPDHVDSHRAPVWVISPYTHRGMTDSTMYNQTSVLRTMELILGLRPMTHFDAGSRPMFATFSQQPDAAPYTAIAPKVSVTDRNPANGPGAKESAKMDFRDADMADDDELTEVVWRAIKHTDPPAPVRSAFGQ